MLQSEKVKDLHQHLRRTISGGNVEQDNMAISNICLDLVLRPGILVYHLPVDFANPAYVLPAIVQSDVLGLI